MRVAPKGIVWCGTYPDGAWGVAIGHRAHWWIDWALPPGPARALRRGAWAVGLLALALWLYATLLGWQALYEDVLRAWRAWLWLQHPA